MGEMFGAPIGIGAAEQDMRQVALGGLQAQEILGKLEQQPAQKALAEAHARLYGAEADIKQGQLEQQKILQKLAEDSANADAAASQGEVYTADQARLAGVGPKSQAEPFERMLALATKQKINPLVTEELGKRAVAIRKDEAMVAYRTAQAIKQQMDTHHEQLAMASSQAQGLLAGGPQNYAKLKAAIIEQTPPGQPSGVDLLPDSFEEAKPFLQQFVVQGMKAKEWLDMQREAAAEKVKEALWKAQAGSAGAAAALSGQRLKLAKQEFDFRAKNDGERSPSAALARESMSRRRDVMNLKELDLAYPQAPADPKLWKEGQKYRIGDKFFTARKGPDGSIGGEPITDIPPSLLSLARKPLSKNAQGTVEADDDEGDD